MKHALSRWLTGFGGLFVVRGGKRAFRSFSDAFNRNRGKHTGAQGALVFLCITQVRIVLEQ